MKKLLLLGGSQQQVIAIETARKMGLQTVLCDYTWDNPGQYVADKFYQISTTNIQAVMDVASREKIDGILAYASDPAAPTAAYVAERLGLPTNPYESVDILCNKGKFRRFMEENGFNTPCYEVYGSEEEALAKANGLKLPLLIKPVDSSGSKGITLLTSHDGYGDAVKKAFSYSRSHRIIVERKIESKYPFVIGGDIFVEDGEIVLWGLLRCMRDSAVNPLVPAGKQFPLNIKSNEFEKLKTVLHKIVHSLNINAGELNVECIIDKESHVYPIDIGPRAGGNYIPQFLDSIYNIDLVNMIINSALGIKNQIFIQHNNKLTYVMHYIHTDASGTLKKISLSAELEQHIIKKMIQKKSGDEIHIFNDSSKVLGIIFLKFDNESSSNKIMNNIKNHVIIEILYNNS